MLKNIVFVYSSTSVKSNYSDLSTFYSLHRLSYSSSFMFKLNSEVLNPWQPAIIFGLISLSSPVYTSKYINLPTYMPKMKTN